MRCWGDPYERRKNVQWKSCAVPAWSCGSCRSRTLRGLCPISGGFGARRNGDALLRIDAAMMHGIVGASATASCLRALRRLEARALVLALRCRRHARRRARTPSTPRSRVRIRPHPRRFQTPRSATTLAPPNPQAGPIPCPEPSRPTVHPTSLRHFRSGSLLSPTTRR